MSVFLVFFFSFFLFWFSLFVFLFSKERERKCVELGVWEGGEDLEVLGEGKHDHNIFHESFFSMKIKDSKTSMDS